MPRSRTIADLNVAVSARTDALRREFERSRRSVRRYSRAVGRDFQEIRRVALLATAAIAAGFTAASVATIRSTRELTQAARSAGVSLQSFQELGAVLAQSSLEQDNLIALLQRSSEVVRELALETATYTEIADELGLTLADFRGLAPDQVFLRLAQALREVEDITQRNALAAGLFGGEAERMGRFLESTSGEVDNFRNRLRRLGATIDDDTAERLAALGDDFDVLARTIRAEFARALVNILPAAGSFDEAIDEVAQAVRVAIYRLAQAVQVIRENIHWVVTATAAWLTWRAVLLAFRVAGIVAAIGRLTVAVGLFTASVVKSSGAVRALQANLFSLSAGSPIRRFFSSLASSLGTGLGILGTILVGRGGLGRLLPILHRAGAVVLGIFGRGGVIVNAIRAAGTALLGIVGVNGAIVVGVVAAGAFVIRYFRELVGVITGLVPVVLNSLTLAVGALRVAILSLFTRQFWVNLWASMTSALGSALAAIGRAFTALGQFLQRNIFGPVGVAFQAVVGWLSAALGAVNTWAEGVASAIYQGIRSGLSRGLDEFRQFLADPLGYLRRFGSEALNLFSLEEARADLGTAQADAAEAVEGLGEALGDLVGAVGSDARAVAGAVGGLGSAIRGTGEAAEEAAEEVVASAEAGQQAVMDALEAEESGFLSTVDDLFRQLSEGITGTIAGVLDDLSDIEVPGGPTLPGPEQTPAARLPASGSRSTRTSDDEDEGEVEPGFFDRFANDLADGFASDIAEAFRTLDFSDLGQAVAETFRNSLASAFQEFLAEQIRRLIRNLFSFLLPGFGGGGNSFHEGGIVPGPVGQERPAVVQAGELVLTRSQQARLFELANRGGVGGGAMTFNFQPTIVGDVTEATRQAIREQGRELAGMVEADFHERGVFRRGG